MSATSYIRPQSAAEVADALLSNPQAQLLAGGQSLLAAWRLGLCNPTHFIDLQDVPDLQVIRQDGDGLWFGAMCTHASIANSSLVRSQAPVLSNLAAGIADAQIRNVGTLGGALANNDPAACWPAAVLAMRAQITTNMRTLEADDFFTGLFATALLRGEWIMGVRFPRAESSHYVKFEQIASRFALVGVAVSRTPDRNVRVAITGLGHGITRWPAAEAALTAQWGVHALDAVRLEEHNAHADLHASAAYRVHLAAVLCRRAVAVLTGESSNMPSRSHEPPAAIPTQHQSRLHGRHVLAATPDLIWQRLLDVEVLMRCIPGCESLTETHKHHYQATVKVGLGPIAAKFKTQVAIFPEFTQASKTPRACRLVLSGHAGYLGEGKATVHVQLNEMDVPGETGPCTRLDWQSSPEVSGKLAQLGNRLMDASAHNLSQQFFTRFGAQLVADPPSRDLISAWDIWRKRVKSLVQRLFQR